MNSSGALDPQKDFNISGNKVVNVADPAEPNHAATKQYVDYLHTWGPDSNVEEYVRYINARNSTLHSIAGLCKLKTTFLWGTDPKRVTVQHIDPYIVLESTTGHCLFLIQEQDLAAKDMTMTYKFPVEVQKWDFCILYQGQDDHQALNSVIYITLSLL